MYIAPVVDDELHKHPTAGIIANFAAKPVRPVVELPLM
ncbi:unnamed protein product, partial [marine sediment metagenome]